MMKSSQKIEFSSASLSYGKAKVQIEVQERNPQLVPRVEWRVGGNPFYSSDCAKCFADLKFSVARTAIYEAGEGSRAIKLASPEHLAPVFLMWPTRRFVVDVACNEECETGLIAEVPMMDGSAISFFTNLRKVCGAPEELVFYDAPVHAEWDLVDSQQPNSKVIFGHVKISPAETFEVEYVIDRSKDRDGYDLKSSAAVSIYSSENLYQIFMARTFIHQVELEQARASGLLAGVDESCGLLLEAGDSSSFAVCNPKFRIASEPAMHKILDLLGDLTFICPALPRVRIEITNGGHVSHRQIMENIIPYVHAGIFTQV